MADFFGFNPSADFEQGLHDDPGDGLDEDADDYDALNDETFGADSMGGDWEQVHEELAQITENSRVHRDSYNSGTEEPLRDLDDELGLQDLDLEASLSQLVDDYDENILDKTKLKQQRAGVIESGYSCSPPSEFNVWAVGEHDQVQRKPQQQPPPPPPPQIFAQKKVHTLEELERGLLKQPLAAMRLEDVERDLKAVKSKFPPGFPRQPGPGIQSFNHQQQQQQQQMQDIILIRNGPSNRTPGGPPSHQQQGNAAFGQVLVPTQLHPGMLDFRHPRPGGPNMMRFLPPHMMMGPHPHGPYNNNMNFRHPHPYPMGHPMMDSRFPPGFRPPYPRHNGPMGGPMGPRYPPGPPGRGGPQYHRDDYDGLMTNREIQWLLNIQLIQLNTTQPYVDDFYYTVFQSRKPKNRIESRNANGHRPESSMSCAQQQQRNYTPLQFENSLGKLQCGSVTAPRKIIDMDVVQNELADSVNSQNLQKDSRRAKQLLLHLEQLYLLLMQVEDIDNPLADMRDQASEKPALVHKILSTLLVEDRLQSAMCIRKGKILLTRLLPHLDQTLHSTQLAELWTCVLKNLILIGRRDGDTNILPNRFYPYFKRWLTASTYAALHRLVLALRILAPYPPSRNLLVYALTNRFGISALSAIINRGEELWSSAEEKQINDWSIFVQDLLEASSLVVQDHLPTPIEPINESTLNQHLTRFDKLTIEKYATLVTLLTGS